MTVMVRVNSNLDYYLVNIRVLKLGKLGLVIIKVRVNSNWDY